MTMQEKVPSIQQITKFVNLITPEKIKQPSSGDCWFCMMVTQHGKPLGEAIGDKSHLISHVRQAYIHGSLIYNALKARGRSDTFIYMAFHDQKGQWLGMVRDDVKKYLVRELHEKGKVSRPGASKGGMIVVSMRGKGEPKVVAKNARNKTINRGE
jgi:hypothetical protein